MKRVIISIFASVFCTIFCVDSFAQGVAQSSGIQYVPDSLSSNRYAVVNLSVSFLRLEPDYESPLETQELMGTVVEITDESGYWRKIVTDQPYTAWCNRLALTEMSAEEIEAYIDASKYICTAWQSTVYSEPSSNSLKLSDLVEGDVLRQVFSGRDDGSAGEAKTKQLVRKGFRAVLLPDGRQGYVPKNDLQDYGQWLASREPSAENIIKEALKFNGIPYLWGGMSPNGVDCSGFVRFVYMMNGVRLPRNASQQVRVGKEIPVVWTSSEENHDSGISVAEFQPADLLFFGFVDEDGARHITHVGMYIGDGKMIHASQVVRINSLHSAAPDYYENTYRMVAARRILTD